MSTALVIIDVQNDYFPSGNFPLHAPEQTLAHVIEATRAAQRSAMPIVVVQHLTQGGPFLSAGTRGAELHPDLAKEVKHAPVVVKQFADAFHQTNLATTLRELGVDEVLLCGMMTQNCVAHTAISKAADNYAVTVLSDACTTVSDVLHQVALHALSTRISIKSTREAFAGA